MQLYKRGIPFSPVYNRPENGVLKSFRALRKPLANLGIGGANDRRCENRNHLRYKPVPASHSEAQQIAGSRMSSLRPKQAQFVAEYLIDLNAKQAAIRAGYSVKTAEKIGSENLSKPDVKAAIAAAIEERTKRVQVDADYVLRRLHEMAEANVKDLYGSDGDLLPVSEWPEVWQKGLITGIEIDALYDGVGKDRTQIGHTKKIKQVDRLSVLQTLGKHVRVNAFQDQVAVTGLDALADRLARAAKRG